jgi:transcriptional regulator with GAF, ATPase, and Fis domain
MAPTDLQRLLNLSSAIAAARNKKDLFHLMAEELKHFIRFDNAVISVLNEESMHFGIFMAHTEASIYDEDAYQQLMRQTFPLVKDSVPYQVVRSERPIIVNIEQQYAEHPEVTYTKLAYELGMREQIVTRLVHSGKVIGALVLVSRQANTYGEADIETLHSLSNLFSIALNNILSNQEIELREQQKSKLLQISTHIATIRDKNDLFRLIAVDMKTFIDFDDVEIAIIDEENQRFRFFLSIAEEFTGTGNNEIKGIPREYPIQDNNPFFNYQTFQSEEPFISDIELMQRKNPGIESIRYIYDLGMREEIVVRLFYSGKIIGVMSVLSKTKNRFNQKDVDTVRSLSSLLAIALNNILSNQEIELREQQKSHLLNISSHIASVRDKGDLFRLIAEEMKSFIEFDDVVIALIDAKKQTYSVFLADVTGTTSKHHDFKQANTAEFPIRPNGLVQKIYSSSTPLLIDIENEYAKHPELDALRFAYNFGMRQEIVVRLTYSGRLIGMMGVLSKKRNRYTRKDVDTVYSLSSMVAIALNNVLANEELKLREQQKTQLLNISANIATVRDRKDLFYLLAEDIRTFIPFDNAIISVIDKNSTEFNIFLSHIDIALTGREDFKEVARQTFPITKGSIPYQVIHSDKPLIIDIKKEHFKNPDVDYLRHAYNFGLQEELATRLMHSGKVIGAFILLSKEAGRYTEADIATLQSLSSLVAIALNNILAKEEIEDLSRQLAQDNLYLNEEIKSNYNFEEIIGESQPLQEVFKKVVQVAHVDSTVLILGETGTGKELIARAIHNLSSRKGRPLIKVNCAALPAQLIESELFGHEKGSFTGATDKRTGKFELAHGSTIFLDEIGELPLELQAKLLRVLQEKEIERIGGEKSIKVDVRIIAATNRNLAKEVSEGKFRSDLYYRLNIYPIELPALRDRKEDIPLLAAFFLRKLSNKLGKKISGISPTAMDELVSNDWPGNVRELEHTIERSMLLTTGKTITALNLSKPVITESVRVKKGFEPKKLADNEKELILQTLKHTKGKIRGTGGAAELLDILPTTLEARMKKLGIRKEFIV